eukprot:556314-Pyramimonas_sp.AAC.1
MILGPEARWQSWAAPRAKQTQRAAQIAAASPPTFVAAKMYDNRALTTLSYVGQFLPLPPSYEREEHALLAS